MEQSKAKDTAAMLIRFYNIQAGTACRTGNEANQKIVIDAIERMNDDVKAVKDHVKLWVAENPEYALNGGFSDCFNTCYPEVPAEDPVPDVTEQAVGSAMGLLEQAVVGLIAKTSAEKIESEIMGSVKDTIRDYIKAEYGPIERKIVTVIDGERKELQGVQHEKFETVLKFVANNEPVFLTGPAGSGKNVLCKQVAEALGLDFYFTNAVTQEYKLTGFTDAMGNFQETQFYKAFKNGGLFMLDEMDASIPEVLVILNAAIANRYFDFPAPIGYVEAHPDFRVIAAGNTVGQGASYEYVGRNQLDAASLDRFAIVKVGYSKQIEDSVAGDEELAEFCRTFRAVAQRVGQQVVVSYRGIGRLAKMTQLLSIEEALETCLTKGMEKDDINVIVKDLPESKYRKALKAIANRM